MHISLQHTLHRAALEDYTEISFDPECNGMSSDVGASECPCNTFALQDAPIASLLLSLIQGDGCYQGWVPAIATPGSLMTLPHTLDVCFTCMCSAVKIVLCRRKNQDGGTYQFSQTNPNR